MLEYRVFILKVVVESPYRQPELRDDIFDSDSIEIFL